MSNRLWSQKRHRSLRIQPWRSRERPGRSHRNRYTLVTQHTVMLVLVVLLLAKTTTSASALCARAGGTCLLQKLSYKPQASKQPAVHRLRKTFCQGTERGHSQTEPGFWVLGCRSAVFSAALRLWRQPCRRGGGVRAARKRLRVSVR